MRASDPYHLERFVAAQNQAGTYDRAVSELKRGRKSSHWMRFVFPQIAGLGQSSMSRTYAISSLDEAKAYLAHPVLGPRLLECARTMANQQTGTAEQILGGIDAQKLRSSMTLFLWAQPSEPVFQKVLDPYFDGEPDRATDEPLLRGHRQGKYDRANRKRGGFYAQTLMGTVVVCRRGSGGRFRRPSQCGPVGRGLR